MYILAARAAKRVMIEIGGEQEEDSEDGMIRSTEMGSKERKVGGMKMKKQVKRDTTQVDRDKGGGEPEKKRQKNNEVETKIKKSRKKVGTRDIKKAETEKENLESRNRLMGWIEAYGIEKQRQTVFVEGAEKHVDRIRNSREKTEVERGEYVFTFRKTTKKVEE